MTEMQNDLITLVDEEGNEHQFMLLDIINVNNSDYAIMVSTEELAADDDIDEQEAVIFRIEEDGDGQQMLIVVDEDEEWEAVVTAWEELIGLDE